MKILRSFVALGAAALLLSGCGLLGGLVPDQQVNDPVGLNNVDVTMTAVSTAATTQAIATATDFSGSADGSFADFDTSSIPSGVTPKSLTAGIDLGAQATIYSSSAVAASDFPDTTTITAASIDITVTDGNGTPSTSASASASDAGGLVQLSKGSCAAQAVGWSCTYDAALVGGVSSMLTVTVSSNFGQLWTIATAGGSPNTVSGTYAVTLDTGVPSDADVTVTLVSPQGTLSF